MTIHQQAIELADKLSKSFEGAGGDGLCGLAWGSINTAQPQVATPVDNMIAQASIPSEAELFTCWLGGWKDAGDAEGRSWYTFGFIDQVSHILGWPVVVSLPADSTTHRRMRSEPPGQISGTPTSTTLTGSSSSQAPHIQSTACGSLALPAILESPTLVPR